MTFEELQFCHFPPPNTSIRGKDSQIQLIFHLNILIFQTNGKQPYSFPVLSRFCNGLLKKIADADLNHKSYSWYSFRNDGASAAANGGISDRVFKRHGRWPSENDKDGYVADSLESRLAVSMSLGLCLFFPFFVFSAAP